MSQTPRVYWRVLTFKTPEGENRSVRTLMIRVAPHEAVNLAFVRNAKADRKALRAAASGAAF